MAEEGKKVIVQFGGILKTLLTGKKDTRYSDMQGTALAAGGGDTVSSMSVPVLDEQCALLLDRDTYEVSSDVLYQVQATIEPERLERFARAFDDPTPIPYQPLGHAEVRLPNGMVVHRNVLQALFFAAIRLLREQKISIQTFMTIETAVSTAIHEPNGRQAYVYGNREVYEMRQAFEKHLQANKTKAITFDGQRTEIIHGHSHVAPELYKRFDWRGVSPLSGRGTFQDSESAVKAQESPQPKPFGLPHLQHGSTKRPIILIDGVWFKQFRLDKIEMKKVSPYADAVAGVFMVDEIGTPPPPAQRWYVTLNGVRMRTAGLLECEQRRSGRYVYRFGELSAEGA